MLYENWLHTGSLNIKTPYCPPLKESISTECLVIGGGIAGLHAALRLIENGKKVILLEKRICGGSSSGQSAGFLTPESEEDIERLIRRYGKKKTEIIYNIPLKGVNLITDTIKKNKFNCDFRKQDSLYLSIKNAHNSAITDEMEMRKDMKLPFKLLDEKGLKKYHPGKGYTLALKYPGSYGINSFAYCQEMKNLLLKKGVKIYEDTEVHSIEKNTAKTHLGSVKAKNIIFCIDKLRKELEKDYSKEYFPLQVYLSITEPLNDKEVKSIFPNGELMCWDTRWDYMHYRLVEGNRLLVGGSSPWTAYASVYNHSPSTISKFIKEIKWRFPQIAHIEFTHYWSGMLDVTKDLVPIADYDKNNKSIQYAIGCAGLNWAAYCGDYLARRVINPDKTEDLTEFLGAKRKFFVPTWAQRFLGKRIAFMINHVWELLK
mgnify:CR=1 FL=1